MDNQGLDRVDFDESLFDDDEPSNTAYIPSLNPDLTPDELEDAERQIKLSRGLAVILGMPGQGKGLFGNMKAFKNKDYFTDRKVLRDDRPRRLFGMYEPFTEETLLEDVARMDKISKCDIQTEIKRSDKVGIKLLSDRINHWRTTEGEVRLKNGILLLDEFWRYFHNRRPMNPMGILLGGVVKVWRHLDVLILGISQQEHELDRYSCLPYVTHKIHCAWSMIYPDTAECHLHRVRFVGSKGVLEVTGRRPTTIYVDGGKQRPELGMTIAKNFGEYQPNNLEQAIFDIAQDQPGIRLRYAWKILKQQFEYEEVKEVVQHMIDNEVMSCPRWYDIYNSKASVSLRPKVSFSM